MLRSINRQNWVAKNYEYFSNYRKIYYREKDRDKVRERTRSYRASSRGKETRREQQKRRLARDPLYRAKRALRKRLWEYKRRFGSISMSKHIGCSWFEFKFHIESLFYDNPITGVSMSWDNYGLNGWEIDHIVPLCTASSLSDLINLSHYTNLQPLWRYDNVLKSTKDLKLKSEFNENKMEENK